jgi:predicted  nucleic acid-binding Zn-ribbon protein
MRTIKTAILFFTVTLLSVSLLGCGGKADESKPMTEVKAEAEKMNVEQLKAAATKYKDAIVAKKADVQKLMDKVKEVPPMEALGDEAKELKTDIDSLNKSISSLKDRFQVYYDKLAEKGGDTSGLQL